MEKRRVVRVGGFVAAALVGCVFSGLLTPRGEGVHLTSRAMAGEPVLASELNEAADTLQLAGLQEKFEGISRRVAPCVVSISAACQAIDGADTLRIQDLNHEKLEAILERCTRMVGTGFIIDPDGYILTNEHVIGEAESIWITTDDRKVYPAIVVGSDPRSDMAILKIPGHDLPFVRFAAYDSVKRGQWAIAMGNPYGLAVEGSNCMSVGIVSAMDRSLPKLSKKENRLYNNLIQTTAQINPGNSGGPLFNLNGEVIGINTAVILPEKRVNGIGFAMPITPQTIATIHDLKEGTEVVYGYLGVVVSTPTEHERREAGVVRDFGVRVDNVEKDSPAATGSLLREQDIITQLNGELIRDADHFVRVIGTCPADKPARVTVYRDGKPLSVDVTVRRRQLSSVAVTHESRRFRWQGMLLGPVPSHWELTATDKPHGGLMVVSIADNSPFSREHINQGDVITTVAGKPVADVTELQKIINDVPASKCDVCVAGRRKAVVATVAGD